MLRALCLLGAVATLADGELTPGNRKTTLKISNFEVPGAMSVLSERTGDCKK